MSEGATEPSPDRPNTEHSCHARLLGSRSSCLTRAVEGHRGRQDESATVARPKHRRAGEGSGLHRPSGVVTVGGSAVTALPAPCEAGRKSRQHDPGSPQ